MKRYLRHFWTSWYVHGMSWRIWRVHIPSPFRDSDPFVNSQAWCDRENRRYGNL